MLRYFRSADVKNPKLDNSDQNERNTHFEYKHLNYLFHKWSKTNIYASMNLEEQVLWTVKPLLE
jgi:hypothetical protein